MGKLTRKQPLGTLVDRQPARHRTDEMREKTYIGPRDRLVISAIVRVDCAVGIVQRPDPGAQLLEGCMYLIPVDVP